MSDQGGVMAGSDAARVRQTVAAIALARYNPNMRRWTLPVLTALAVLLVPIGAYTVFWLIVAARIKDGVSAWAQTAQSQKIEASWQQIRISGFPTAFRAELETADLRDGTLSPSPELHIPALSGSARPWDLLDWQIAAQHGLSAELPGAGARPPVKLAARAAAGALSIAPEGGGTLWLTLQDSIAEAGERVRISSADGWVILPPKPAQGHADPTVAVALDLRQVQLPVATRGLGDTIDELAFGLTVKGVVPGGKLAQAVSAWRDAGGTVELDNLRLSWGGLGATATGTIALDQELQPVGGFFGAIEGYDQVLTALVQNGHMRASDAGLARLVLTMLAKAGPDGRPEIKTAFTIQNGQMYLGPARLDQAPRIPWE
jgi:hypothetical protein